MDLSLSEEQEMLRTSARSFLTNECPKTLVREMEETEKGYSPELWSKMANLGWMALAFPEKYGGAGMSFLDLVVLITEMGRALVPGPFLSTVVCCGYPILWAGNEKQRQGFLPKIASGSLIMTLALTEPSARFDAAGVSLQAIMDKNEYVLTGTKLFVPDAHVADWMLVAARTKKSRNLEDGVSLFLVDTRTPGIKVELLKTIASDRQAEVVFDKVRVSNENILGKVDKGWEILTRVMQYAATAQCALMVGGAQQVLEMTVEYAKERVQFDRPIGSFQAIQHKCADMVIDIDGARLLTYQAAWKLSAGMSATAEVAMAKSWTGEAYRCVCMHGHQIHGGVGITKDHDLPLYTRRAKASELAFGDADVQLKTVARELVAQNLLGQHMV